MHEGCDALGGSSDVRLRRAFTRDGASDLPSSAPDRVVRYFEFLILYVCCFVLLCVVVCCFVMFCVLFVFFMFFRGGPDTRSVDPHLKFSDMGNVKLILTLGGCHPSEPFPPPSHSTYRFCAPGREVIG